MKVSLELRLAGLIGFLDELALRIGRLRIRLEELERRREGER